MTVETFNPRSSWALFGSDRRSDGEARAAKLEETRTGHPILVATLYDFSSENCDSWVLATNITRWLKREQEPF